MKPLKRFERYLSAIFTLGRIKGLAKDAQRGVEQIHPRVDHLESRSAQIERDLAAMQVSLDARQFHLEDADRRMHQLLEWTQRHEHLAEDLVADYRRENAILKRTGQSDNALLARMFSDLSRRLDATPKGLGVPKSAAPKTALPSTDGFDLFKDSFYHRLENQFRGAPEEIARRL
ncbi:MAG: hypothetical protein WA790_02000, partial [Sulfitobacter sp.]